MITELVDDTDYQTWGGEAGLVTEPIRKLKLDEKNTPVLILSAVNQLSNLGFSFTENDISDDFMPVSGFIEKPVKPDELLARIKQAESDPDKLN